MKALPALFFALVITMVIGASMLVIGSNALFNKNSVPVLNSPNTTNVSAAIPSSNQQTVEQMQQLITQYQAREKQYQTELNDAAQQLSQANQQLNQYSQMMDSVQRLLNELQRRGIITITNDGQILIPNNGIN
jgi:peptidoglycan hydrolase CwlO-like protein